LVHVILADLQADARDLKRASRNLGIGREHVERMASRRTLDLVDRVEEKL